MGLTWKPSPTQWRAGSLSAAALALDLPKSHVSRRLTALETALGSKLLDRSRSGVRLNELGERFYQRARLIWWTVPTRRWPASVPV